MIHYFILSLMFTSVSQAEERVILFQQLDRKDNSFEYYSTKEKLKTLKEISINNLEEMITPKKALLALESSLEFKKEKLTRKDLRSIDLDLYYCVVNLNGKKHPLYTISYSNEGGFHKSFYVLSNGVVLERKQISIEKK